MQCEEVNEVEIEEAEVGGVENIAERDDIYQALGEVRALVLINEELMNPGVFKAIKEKHDFHDDHKQ
jgi:hypothetical protein